MRLKRIISLINDRDISKAILVSNKYNLLYFYISTYLNRKLVLAYLVRDSYIVDNL